MRADLLDQRSREVVGDDEVYKREAAKFRELGKALLKPTNPVTYAASEPVTAILQAESDPVSPRKVE